MATAALPTTRLIRRPRRAGRGWLVGIGITIAANLGVIVLLTSLGRRADELPPEVAVHRLEVVPPPPAEPPPPPEKPPEPPPEIEIALPSLALPTTPTSVDFALPAVMNEGVVDLPLDVPPFAAIAPTVASAPATPSVATDSSADHPARLPPGIESALERYYPRTAKLRGIEGDTRVTVDIAADGSVTAVAIISSTPPNVFDEAVVKALTSQRFTPAVIGGRPAPTRLEFPLRWTIRNKR